MKAIDQLSVEDNASLKELEDDLAQVYGHEGSWDEIVAATMEFPANLPEIILQMWKENQDIAEENGDTLEAQDFAEMFVDENLAA